MNGSYNKAYNILKKIADSNKRILPSKETLIRSMKVLTSQIVLVSLYFIFEKI